MSEQLNGTDSMTLYESNDIYSFALEYLKHGLSILPIKPRTKISLIKWNRYKNDPMALEEVKVFFKNKSSEEVGIAMVLNNGVIGIDFDRPELMPFILGDKDPREFTWVSKSKKGVHVYLRARIKQNIEVPGVVEVKAKNKYLIAPPSIHPSGMQYSWLTDITKKNIFELNENGTNALIKRIQFLKKHWKLIEIIDSAWKKGQRNQVALFTAGVLRKSGWSKEDTSDLLWILCLLNGDTEEYNRISAVEKTYEQNIENVAGVTKLGELLDEEKLKSLKQILKTRLSNTERRKLQDIEIIKWLEKNGTFFIDQQFEFYYKNSETVNIDSIYFDKIIRNFYTSVTGQIIPKERLNRIKDESKSRALDNNFITFNRIGQNKDIFYDLGKSGIVQITSNGWNLKEKEPDNVFFNRYKHKTEQVIPVFDKNFDVDGFIGCVFNLKNKIDYDLFKVFLIACFIPEIDHPVLSLFGSEGSGKTKFLEFIKQTVDPSLVLTLALSRDAKDRVLALNQNYLVCFDNLSQIDTPGTYNEVSNQFSRATTGSGIIERELYTNRGTESFVGRTIVCINGINSLVKMPDLADRTLTFELERIYSPIPDTELKKIFLDGLPKLLGWIFNILSRYLKEKDNEKYIRYNSLPRLAGFGKAGAVIADLIGWNDQEFLKSFNNKILSLKFDLAGEDDLIQLIVKFIQQQEEKKWCGSSSELLNELRALGNLENIDIDYIKSGRILTIKLNKFKVILKEMGIEYSYNRKGANRKRTLCFKLASDGGDLKGIDNGDRRDLKRPKGNLPENDIGDRMTARNPTYLTSEEKKINNNIKSKDKNNRESTESSDFCGHAVSDNENTSVHLKKDEVSAVSDSGFAHLIEIFPFYLENYKILNKNKTQCDNIMFRTYQQKMEILHNEYTKYNGKIEGFYDLIYAKYYEPFKVSWELCAEDIKEFLRVWMKDKQKNDLNLKYNNTTRIDKNIRKEAHQKDKSPHAPVSLRCASSKKNEEDEDLLLPFKITGNNSLKKTAYILEVIESGGSPKESKEMLKRGIKKGLLKDRGDGYVYMK